MDDNMDDIEIAAEREPQDGDVRGEAGGMRGK